MKESLLNVKSKEFALQIIKLCNQINPLAGDGNPFVLTVGQGKRSKTFPLIGESPASGTTSKHD